MSNAEVTDPQALIAVVDERPQARYVLRELQRFGISTERLSVLGKGATRSDRAAGVYMVGGSPRPHGGIGAIWDGMWGVVQSALAAIGAPISSIVQHGAELSEGKVLMFVHGDREELLLVCGLLLEMQVPNTELLVA